MKPYKEMFSLFIALIAVSSCQLNEKSDTADQELSQSSKPESMEIDMVAEVTVSKREEADLCLLKGNDQRAFELYSELAELGDAASILHLAWFYESGEGGQVTNYQKAYDLYFQAMEGQGGIAALGISRLYSTGCGSFQADQVKCSEWREKAEALLVAEDSADAFYILGMAFRSEKELGVDPEKSFSYYHCAAEQGNVAAMISVARAYYEGNGVDVDLGKARDWLKKAYLISGDSAINQFVERYHPRTREKLKADFIVEVKGK